MTSFKSKFRAASAVLFVVAGLLGRPTGAASPPVERAKNLSELYRDAEIVAIVRVENAETATFRHPVFEARVVESWKGSKVMGNTVYFESTADGLPVPGITLVLLRKSGMTVSEASTSAHSTATPTRYPPAAQLLQATCASPVLYSGSLKSTDPTRKVYPIIVFDRGCVELPEELEHMSLDCEILPHRAWVTKQALGAYFRAIGAKPKGES